MSFICIYLYLLSILGLTRRQWNSRRVEINLSMRQHLGVRYISLGELRYPRDYRRGDDVHLSAAGYRLVWGAIRRKLCYLFG